LTGKVEPVFSVVFAPGVVKPLTDSGQLLAAAEL